jgi:hypothetical protein
VTTGVTQKVLELSAGRLKIQRGCWNSHHDWKHTEGAGINSMTTEYKHKVLELLA